ncbi:MAG: hypothetical protein ACJ8G3_07095 [Burkholderiaceae bacterium]
MAATSSFFARNAASIRMGQAQPASLLAADIAVEPLSKQTT